MGLIAQETTLFGQKKTHLSIEQTPGMEQRRYYRPAAGVWLRASEAFHRVYRGD